MSNTKKEVEIRDEYFDSNCLLPADMSYKTTNTLINGGVHSFEHLVVMTYDDLYKIKNIGPLSIKEIAFACSQAVISRMSK